jgi:hypothetical protein
MHPLLALALLCFYAYLGLSLLPFLLALSGGFVLVYLLAGSFFHAPPMSTRRKLMMASWSAPSDGTVFGILNVNAEPLMAYMDKVRHTWDVTLEPRVALNTQLHTMMSHPISSLLHCLLTVECARYEDLRDHCRAEGGRSGAA